MKTFTIDQENNITVHASKQAASETGSGLFSTPKQFADLIGTDSKRLVEIWNSITGVVPVKKFKDRKTAADRIWKALQSLGETVPSEKSEDSDVVATIETMCAAEEAPTPDANETGPEPEAAPPANVGAPPAPDVTRTKAPAKPKATRQKKEPQTSTIANSSRPGSKTETILHLMQQPGGTTLPAIMEASGWQAHSVRGFISGTLGKKMGLTVVSTKNESGERRYSIQA